MASRIDPDRPVARKWKTSPPRCKTLQDLFFFLRGTSQRAQLPRHLFGGARILDSDGELDEVLAVEKTHV